MEETSSISAKILKITSIYTCVVLRTLRSTYLHLQVDFSAKKPTRKLRPQTQLIQKSRVHMSQSSLAWTQNRLISCGGDKYQSTSHADILEEVDQLNHITAMCPSPAKMHGP